MAIHKGTVNCRSLSQLIHNILVAEGYTQISSEITTDGRVYKSPSIDGKNTFYIKIKDPSANYLTVGIYELYTPGISGVPGVFGNGYEGGVVAWNYNTHADRFDVDYVINVNDKRVIFYVSGKKGETWMMDSLVYIGLPTANDPNDNSGSFAGMAYTANGPYNNPSHWYALRNRANLTIQVYDFEFYKVGRSFGWGGKLFFTPIYIGRSDEGHRGILDGIYLIERTDKTHEISAGDTFIHDGKTYMLITPTAWGGDTMNTGHDYLIEV